MWIKTTQEVYGEIFKAHRSDLRVHATFSDAEGTLPFGHQKPAMDTEWGFRGADEPLIRNFQTKENRHQKEWDVEYFIWKHNRLPD